MADYAGKGLSTVARSAGEASAGADALTRQHQRLAQGVQRDQQSAVALKQPDGQHKRLARDSAKRFPR